MAKVYDVSGTLASNELFVQPSRMPVHLLSFDDEESMLVCCDLGARVTVRRMVQRRVGRRKYVWDVPGDPLIDVLSPGPDQVKQVLLAGNRSRLLVVTETSTTLWSVLKQKYGLTEGPLLKLDRGGARWLAHPTDKGLLLNVQDSQATVFSWADLGLVSVVPLSLGRSPKSVVPLSGSQFVASPLCATPYRPRVSFLITIMFPHLQASRPAGSPTVLHVTVPMLAPGARTKNFIETSRSPNNEPSKSELPRKSPHQDAKYAAPCSWYIRCPSSSSPHICRRSILPHELDIYIKIPVTVHSSQHHLYNEASQPVDVSPTQNSSISPTPPGNIFRIPSLHSMNAIWISSSLSMLT